MLVKYRPATSLLSPFFDETWFTSRTDEECELVPRADIIERKDEYVVFVEMPGVSKDDFHVDLENNVLTIRGKKNIHEKRDDEQFIRVERQCGNYKRSFRLGEEIEKDKIEAKYRDGVLEVVLPKAEQVKPKSIEIKIN
jgi:HSP20 family protein